MPEVALPEEFDADLSADYVNEATEQALDRLREAPNYERLAQFLTVLREGFLFVDVTGAISKKRGTRVRTTRSTRGQLLLPVFTSMEALRAAVQSGGRRGGSGGGSGGEAKGVLMPARDALNIITEDRFVAAQLNPGPAELVILRKYIELVIGEEPIDADLLETMK